MKKALVIVACKRGMESAYLSVVFRRYYELEVRR